MLVLFSLGDLMPLTTTQKLNDQFQSLLAGFAQDASDPGLEAETQAFAENVRDTLDKTRGDVLDLCIAQPWELAPLVNLQPYLNSFGLALLVTVTERQDYQVGVYLYHEPQEDPGTRAAKKKSFLA
jgi:hypothetical protein